MDARSTIPKWTAGDWTVVRSSILFRGLSVERIRRLTADAETCLVPGGHVFYRTGDRVDALRLVLSGGVLLERDGAGGEAACFDVCEAGRTFGDFAALLDRPSSNWARAAGVVRIMILPVEPFRRFLVEDSELAIAIIASAVAHARATADQLVRIKSLTSVCRIGDLLLRLSHERGGSLRFSLPYEKAVLAHMIGMRPESFSRGLSQLASAGVAFEGDVVLLTSLQRLRLFVTGCSGSPPSEAT